jgi:hypothetical protein
MWGIPRGCDLVGGPRRRSGRDANVRGTCALSSARYSGFRGGTPQTRSISSHPPMGVRLFIVLFSSPHAPEPCHTETASGLSPGFMPTQS